ncbi:hypothetical protein EI94DRAFT_1218653 [Lactarius quietus]|nr:hypothetical protein EI94DRAFT_1218653 [Lactarius quietus]
MRSRSPRLIVMCSGTSGYLDKCSSQADLTSFMVAMVGYRTGAKTATFAGFDPRAPWFRGETNIQYAEVMTYPTPHIYYCAASVAMTAVTRQQRTSPGPGQHPLDISQLLARPFEHPADD